MSTRPKCQRMIHRNASSSTDQITPLGRSGRRPRVRRHIRTDPGVAGRGGIGVEKQAGAAHRVACDVRRGGDGAGSPCTCAGLWRETFNGRTRVARARRSDEKTQGRRPSPASRDRRNPRLSQVPRRLRRRGSPDARVARITRTQIQFDSFGQTESTTILNAPRDDLGLRVRVKRDMARRILNHRHRARRADSPAPHLVLDYLSAGFPSHKEVL